jgi:hypothetical protein
LITFFPLSTTPFVKVAMPRSLHHLIETLDSQRGALLDGLEALDAPTLRARPRPGAWSILEILEHVVVAESVILLGPTSRAELVARPRTLEHRLKYFLVLLVLKLRIPVRVPSRRMLPTGQRSLAELRAAWDGHVRWLRAFAEEAKEDSHGQAFFTHPVAGPITLVQALRMDLLHLRIHSRQIANLRPQLLRPKA